MILLYCPLVLQFLASFAGTLPSSRTRILLNILPYPWVPIGSGLQRLISSGPILCLAYPGHFLHHIRTSPCLSILLTRSCPPKCRLPYFPNFLTRILACSNICFLFHISYDDTCLLPHTTLFDASFPRSSYPQNPLFFRLGPELFTVLPFLYQAVEAGRILQCCIHLLMCPAALSLPLLLP